MIDLGEYTKRDCMLAISQSRGTLALSEHMHFKELRVMSSDCCSYARTRKPKVIKTILSISTRMLSEVF